MKRSFFVTGLILGSVLIFSESNATEYISLEYEKDFFDTQIQNQVNTLTNRFPSARLTFGVLKPVVRGNWTAGVTGSMGYQGWGDTAANREVSLAKASLRAASIMTFGRFSNSGIFTRLEYGLTGAFIGDSNELSPLYELEGLGRTGLIGLGYAFPFAFGKAMVLQITGSQTWVKKQKFQSVFLGAAFYLD